MKFKTIGLNPNGIDKIKHFINEEEFRVFLKKIEDCCNQLLQNTSFNSLALPLDFFRQYNPHSCVVDSLELFESKTDHISTYGGGLCIIRACLLKQVIIKQTNFYPIIISPDESSKEKSAHSLLAFPYIINQEKGWVLIDLDLNGGKPIIMRGNETIESFWSAKPSSLISFTLDYKESENKWMLSSNNECFYNLNEITQEELWTLAKNTLKKNYFYIISTVDQESGVISVVKICLKNEYVSLRHPKNTSKNYLKIQFSEIDEYLKKGNEDDTENFFYKSDEFAKSLKITSAEALWNQIKTIVKNKEYLNTLRAI